MPVSGQTVVAPGYSIAKVSNSLTVDQVENITQLAFDPGDNAHVYASRFGYNTAATSSGLITRYDYNSSTGALSNPVNIATGLGVVNGLGFFQHNIYFSTTPNVSTDNQTGGISLLASLGNGLFGAPVPFINNVPVGEHQLDQIQVSGNSLYVGIGTITNTGDPIKETVYNGTIGVIQDLTRANVSAAGADNLPLGSVLTDTDPGKLHVFASGFRNPFGVRVDAFGNVSATDNGADTPNLTPDLFYKNLTAGAKGIFPVGNGGTFLPLTSLGFDTSADGFDVLRDGPLAGRYVVALFNTGSQGPLAGNELVTIDPSTGAFAPFVTGMGNPLDVVHDPFGNLLVTDYGPSFYNNYDPNSGAIFRLAAAVPEPSSGALMLIAVTLIGAVAWVRGRRTAPA